MTGGHASLALCIPAASPMWKYGTGEDGSDHRLPLWADRPNTWLGGY